MLNPEPHADKLDQRPLLILAMKRDSQSAGLLERQGGAGTMGKSLRLIRVAGVDASEMQAIPIARLVSGPTTSVETLTSHLDGGICSEGPRDIRPLARVATAAVDNTLLAGPGLTLRRFLEDHVTSTDQGAYPVVEDERVVGIVCVHDVGRVARGDWDTTHVRDVMASQVAALGPNDSATVAMNELRPQQVNELPVVDGGAVRGIVRREDITRWVSLYVDPGQAHGDGAWHHRA